LKKSFTLLEVVITVGLFVLFISALMALSASNTKIITLNKHRLVAANLAREGMEEVTQIRDTAWLNNETWNNLVNNCWGLNLGSTKHLEFTGDTAGCPSGVVSPFWHYKLSPGSEIISKDNVQYERAIRLVPVADPNTKRITIEVYWTDFSPTPNNKNVTMIKDLTDWK